MVAAHDRRHPYRLLIRGLATGLALVTLVTAISFSEN
jgi:hypothetical protein